MVRTSRRFVQGAGVRVSSRLMLASRGRGWILDGDRLGRDMGIGLKSS